MQLNAQTLGFFTALCVGFLIGIVRERLHQPGVMVAGVRTHTLAAVMGAVALVLRIAFLLLHNPLPVQFELPNTEGAFQLNHVFVISLSISSVSLMSHWMGLWFGDSGTFGTAVIVGFAEIHSSAVSIAHLANDHAMPSPLAQWGVICVLAASAVSKTVLSFVVGGPAYGRHVALSLLMFIVTAASSLWIFHHS